MGIPSSTAGPQARGHKPPSRRAKAVVSCASKKNDELRVMSSEAICSWWEERDLKQGAKRRSGKSSDGRPKRLLAKFPCHCHMH